MKLRCLYLTEDWGLEPKTITMLQYIQNRDPQLFLRIKDKIAEIADSILSKHDKFNQVIYDFVANAASQINDEGEDYQKPYQRPEKQRVLPRLPDPNQDRIDRLKHKYNYS